MIALAIVVPCYNEREVLPETAMRLIEALEGLAEKGKIGPQSRVYFVDDGSMDGTWNLIEEIVARGRGCVGIKLARNVGHQRALLAGVLSAEGDAVVSIDADLQDDVSAIEPMLDEHARGSEIVYGVRATRAEDTRFKRLTARSFYRLMRWMGVRLVEDHADFRLMGRRAVEALRGFDEVNLFLRGMVPLIGFSSTTVYYHRAKRYAGESKYPLRRMLSLAWEGVTSMSVVPLRMITIVGALVFLFSSVMSLWVVAAVLFTDKTVPGWASTVLPIYFIGGVQILCIGILGEYAGKIYTEVKRRPRFLIERVIGPGDAAQPP